MPTYEYICQNCQHEFEEFQSITAKSLRKCPECSKLKLKRKIGIGAGVIFKGGGFYETDYRSEGYKKSAEADKKAQTGGSDTGKKSDSDSSDSKSSSKTESTSKITSSTSETKKTDAKPSSSGSSDKPKGGSKKTEA